MEERLSYLSLERVVKWMKILGLYPINLNSSEIQHRLHKIYRRIVLFLAVLYTFQEVLNIYEVRDDADKVMATIFLFLTYTDYIYKMIIIDKKSKQIEELLEITKGLTYNQGEPEHREPLQQAVRLALTVGPIYTYMAALTCILWSLHPTILHIQGKFVEFPIWLPFDSNLSPQFYIVVMYSWFQTTWLAFGNTTYDIFITFLIYQCKSQLAVLRIDLESIVVKSRNEKLDTSLTLNEILTRRFRKLIIHHNEIVSMSVKIGEIFGGVVFYQFIIGGWILCTSMYCMTNANPASVEFISMITYIICILIQCFLYCYLGNEVTIESELLARSAYEMDWLSLPVTHRRILIIFMERCKHSIKPIAGQIIPLSNSTFVSPNKDTNLKSHLIHLLHQNILEYEDVKDGKKLDFFKCNITLVLNTRIVRSSYTFYAFLKNSNKDA